MILRSNFALSLSLTLSLTTSRFSGSYEIKIVDNNIFNLKNSQSISNAIYGLLSRYMEVKIFSILLIDTYKAYFNYSLKAQKI